MRSAPSGLDSSHQITCPHPGDKEYGQISQGLPRQIYQLQMVLNSNVLRTIDGVQNESHFAKICPAPELADRRYRICRRNCRQRLSGRGAAHAETHTVNDTHVAYDGHAYWRFIQAPAGPIARLNSVWVDIAYPWRVGDAHVIVIVSNSGATFEHEIEVALAAPSGQVGQLRSQAALVGFVGILPVSIGLLFFPLLVRLKKLECVLCCR